MHDEPGTVIGSGPDAWTVRNPVAAAPRWAGRLTPGLSNMEREKEVKGREGSARRPPSRQTGSKRARFWPG